MEGYGTPEMLELLREAVNIGVAYLRHGRNEALSILEQYRRMINSTPENKALRTNQAETLKQLSIDHISYQIEDLTILNDICAHFTAGRKYLIIGKSGSGKSTLPRFSNSLFLLCYFRGQYLFGEANFQRCLLRCY